MQTVMNPHQCATLTNTWTFSGQYTPNIDLLSQAYELNKLSLIENLKYIPCPKLI